MGSGNHAQSLHRDAIAEAVMEIRGHKLRTKPPSHYRSSGQARKEGFSFFPAMLGAPEGGVDTVSLERESLAL